MDHQEFGIPDGNSVFSIAVESYVCPLGTAVGERLIKG
jgi:hypothetical protein